jgi:acyl-CoA thioesterase YciA
MGLCASSVLLPSCRNPEPLLAPGPTRPQTGGMNEIESPRGELALRMSAMPANTNAAGDIFGGWIMSMMDLAAGSFAHELAQGRVATVAVSDLVFLRPVRVGNMVSCYAELVRMGKTSITVDIDVWARRSATPLDNERVTKARFVLVAVDKEGKPRLLEGRPGLCPGPAGGSAPRPASLAAY